MENARFISRTSRPGRLGPRRTRPRGVIVLAAMFWSLGCLGCQRPAVVPPAASISRPQLPPAIEAPPAIETPVMTAPQESEVSPIAPIAKGNPWKPETAAREWKYIVLHHTATEQGDVESIHESHLRNKDKNGKPWLGIGYHFVVGNGQGMSDGQVEPTFRWKQQLQGAHAGVADYNQFGVGLVLVGNFENRPPTAAQVASVKRLVRVLSREYDIPSAQIVGHGDVKATECPGRHFPLAEVRESVASLQWEDRSATSPLR